MSTTHIDAAIFAFGQAIARHEFQPDLTKSVLPEAAQIFSFLMTGRAPVSKSKTVEECMAAIKEEFDLMQSLIAEKRA